MTTRNASLIQLASDRFQQLYGAGEALVWRAPARINVLGEHVDYVSYLPTASLPFGSHEHEMVMMLRPNAKGVVRGSSLDERFEPFEFPLPTQSDFRGQTWVDFLYAQTPPAPSWSNYVKGATYYAVLKWGAKVGFDFVVASNIPPQGGSSSSSALVVLAGAAIRTVNNLAFLPKELAQDSAQAEWFVGTRGGALDHTAICLARRNHAIHLRYAENDSQLIPLLSDGFRWVTFYTHAADKGREILLEYNERAVVARLLIPAILEEWKLRNPKLFSTWEDCLDFWKVGDRPIAPLQDVVESQFPSAITLTEVADKYPSVFSQCQQSFPSLVSDRAGKALKLKDRALHHLGEIDRVRKAVQVLHQSIPTEEKMHRLGTLISASHLSLRDLYEVSSVEVEHLHTLLVSDARVLGARLIGGGFGGNVLALTKSEDVEGIVEEIQEKFYSPRHRDGRDEGAVMISTPGDGATPTTLL